MEKHADIDASEAHRFRGVGAIELPAPGLGSLDYDDYLRRLSRKHPNIPLIIEHLDEADVPRAKRFIDAQIARQRSSKRTVERIIRVCQCGVPPGI